MAKCSAFSGCVTVLNLLEVSSHASGRDVNTQLVSIGWYSDPNGKGQDPRSATRPSSMSNPEDMATDPSHRMVAAQTNTPLCQDIFGYA
ncbi:hypothetical protein C8T65DRAFT_296082 [Cerioporus squamosus]|nr:hypothetical protein C8T65DRAFT_296082 [Cerioporus squamosus]